MRSLVVMAAIAGMTGAPAWAADAVLDTIGPAVEPREAAPPPAPAADDAPLEARPNSVVPGGMTVDLQGRGEQPITAVVGPDGKVRVRSGGAGSQK
jgi:hypothetical protein